jgi:quinol monooxygenase YgiN
MQANKFILLVEAEIIPEHRAAVIAVAAETLEKTRAESGCEILYQTVVADKPNQLVFFEVFSSEEEHKAHLEQAYAKHFFAFLEGKLASAPVITRLTRLAS